MNSVFKLSIVSIVIMLSTITLAFSQYLKVIESSKSWNYFSSNFHEQMDSCYITDDTIINQEIYFEVYSLSSDGMGPEFLCYLREDTISGRIYRIPSLNQINDELLVYDISLNVGDTFCIDFNCNIVDSIKYIGNRKHIYFYGTLWFIGGAFEFVEGIGSLANMFGISAFGYYHSVLLCAYNDSLNIYTHDSIPFLTYKDSTLCKVDLTIGINEKSSDNYSFTVYPNPGFDDVTFQICNDNISRYNGSYYLVVFNMLGIEQCKYSFNASKRQIKINVEHFKPGIYISVLKNDKGILGRRKFVVR